MKGRFITLAHLDPCASGWYELEFVRKTQTLRGALWGLVVLVSCAPMKAASKLVEARTELQIAQESNARRHSTYEYTAAKLYLEKAEEEASEADYDAATHLASKASTLAKEAAERARTAQRSEALRPKEQH